MSRHHDHLFIYLFVLTNLLLLCATINLLEAHEENSDDKSRDNVRHEEGTGHKLRQAKLGHDYKNELCSDQKSCVASKLIYLRFFKSLKDKVPNIASKYTSILKSLSNSLKSTVKGQEFIKKYNLTGENSVEHLISHKSTTKKDCTKCMCPWSQYTCQMSTKCDEVPRWPNCAQAPKCPREDCKLIRNVANGIETRQVIVGHILVATSSIEDELVDCLSDADFEILLRPVVLAWFQLDEIEPKCDGPSCKLMHQEYVLTKRCIIIDAILSIISNIFRPPAPDPMSNEKPDRIHVAELSAKPTDHAANGNNFSQAPNNFHNDLKDRHHGTDDSVEDKKFNSTQRPDVVVKHEETYRPNIHSTKHPISIQQLSSGTNPMTTSAPSDLIDDAKKEQVILMRQAVKHLVNKPNSWYNSERCGCEHQTCESESYNWICVNYCPNNNGCDMYACECPFRTKF